MTAVEFHVDQLLFRPPEQWQCEGNCSGPAQFLNSMNGQMHGDILSLPKIGGHDA